MNSPQRIRLAFLVLAVLTFAGAANAACTASGSASFSTYFFMSAGGSGTVSFNFSAASGCTYYVTSDSPWLTSSVPSATPNGSTSAVVTYTVAANSGGNRRGNLTAFVNGASVGSFGVSNNGTACTTVITSQNPAHFTAAGGTGTYTFNTQFCDYIGPNTSATWMRPTAYAATSISYSVDPNTGPARSSTFSFSEPSTGQSMVVNQDGANTTPFTVSPTSLSFSANAGTSPGGQPISVTNIYTGSVSVSLSASSSGWLSVSPGSLTIGQGQSSNATVNVSSNNLSPGTYNGSITVQSTSPAFSVTVPVQLTVSGVSISVSPSSATVAVQTGKTASTSFTISGGSSGIAVASSLSFVAGGSANAPGSFTANVNAAGITAGSYSGTLTFSCTGGAPCVAQPVSLTVNVSALPCTFSASPTSIPTVAVTGGSATFTVTNTGPSGCSGGSWAASVSDPTWMSISPSGGTAAGSATATFQANNTLSPRTGTITIAGQSVSVSQPAGTTCTFSATPTSVPTVLASGGSASFTVTNAGPAGCIGGSWSASVSDPTWMSISPSGGTAAGSATATFQPNTNVSPRSGTITIAGTSISVSQNGVTPACVFTATPGSVPQVPSTGGSASFTVTNTGPSGCGGGSWAASVSDPTWMSISPSGGTAAGSATATFLANTIASPRSGTISIAGQSVSVSQAAATTCTFTATPGSVPTVAASGGSASFTVSNAGPSGCVGGAWAASVSDPTWMSISPSGGTAAGSATATFQPNTNVSPRSGSINIAGISVSVSQNGATPACTFTATPTSVATIAAGGGSASFTISNTGPNGCSGGAWSASVSDPTWMSIAPAGGTAAGSATATFGANPGTSLRSGTVTIANQGVAISQAGQAQPLQMSCSPSNGPAVILQAYATACTASGGTPPYAWSATGLVPPGLSLSSATGPTSGFAGAPQTAGTFNYGIQVQDSTGKTQAVPFSASIGAGLSISTGSLPPAVVGAIYSQALVATGGVPPYTWSLSIGNLPGGLSLGGDTGAFSGTPGVGGTFNFTAKVTDTANGSATKALSITVGGNPLTVSPGQLTFTAQQGGAAPATQSLSVFATAAANFTAAASGGAWLSVSPGSGQTPGSVNVTATPGNLAPNTYTGVVTITGTNTSPPSVPVSVTLVVSAPPPSQLTVSPANISAALVANSGPSTQQFSVINPGNTPLPFTVSGGTPWLNLLTSSGTAPAGGAPALVSFSLTPAGLAAGTYSTALQVSGGGGPAQSVNVTLLVSALTQTILLTQSGLHFVAVAQGQTPLPQNFAVLNTGLGPMSWQVNATTLSGGNGWLQATPSNGSSTAGSLTLTPVTVSVNASTLAAGEYFGAVGITAPGAANSPQQVTVVLDVLPAGQIPPPLVIPSGAILTGTAGGANPQPGQVSLNNVGAGAVTFTSTVSTQDGQNWLQQSPVSGSVTPGVPLPMTLNASTTGLGAGVRQGTVRVAFSDGTVQEIAIALVLASGPGAAAPLDGKTQREANGTCDANTLTVNPQGTVQSNSTLTALQPATFQVQVVDCGLNNVDDGTVTAFFDTLENADGLKLKPRGSGGVWTESWTPSTKSPVVNITVRAASVKGVTPRAGSVKFPVNIVPNKNTAAAQPQGVQNNASYKPTQNIAPGSFTSIFGEQLAPATQTTTQAPFPLSLQNTQVKMGDKILPLYFVSAGQVNALVPWKLAPNTQQQLTVIRDNTEFSTPLLVTVADVEPGIYTTSNTGKGQGSILISGTATLAAPLGIGRPANRGEYIEIYCTGLGPVDHTPDDGTSSPAAEPFARTVNAPNVTIGGVKANVVFSGLAPGLIGLYQINAQVPAGAPVGDAVPVLFTIGNATSNTVSIAVQ